MLPHNQKESETEAAGLCLHGVETPVYASESDVHTGTVGTDTAVVDRQTEEALRILVEAISCRPTLKNILSNPLRNAGVITLCLFLLFTVPPVGILIVGMLVIVLGGVAISLSESNVAIQAAVGSLATTEDLRAIGPLAEVSAWWESVYPAASATLARLLPRLQPSDAGLLNERQLHCLRRALKQNSNRLLFWHHDPIFAGILRQALTTLDALPIGEQAADEGLTERTAAPMEPLLDAFQAAVRQRRQNTVMMGVSAALSAGFAVTNLIVEATHSQDESLFWAAIGALGVTFALSFRGVFRLKGLMNNLANIRDLRITGPLIEIAALEEGNANKMAAQLLTRLLPRFRASDAKLLTDGQHAALLRTLNRANATPEYFVAVLKALEQIGDARALPVVESLATGRRATSAPRRVQAAAQDCLPFLRIRCDQQRASQTLLRASDAAGMQPDTLLRPAQGVGPTEATELLRAGSVRPDND